MPHSFLKCLCHYSLLDKDISLDLLLMLVIGRCLEQLKLIFSEKATKSEKVLTSVLNNAGIKISMGDFFSKFEAFAGNINFST